MKGKLLPAIAGAAILVSLAVSAAAAQTAAPVGAAGPTVESAAPIPAAELDQLVAPIALYPDELLDIVLMAATYPFEVIEADRWLGDPANAALRGDALVAALEAKSWEPSVKSLVPYPRVLRMMDQRLEWTERLGEAFLADPAAVMDAIQRLRRRASSAGVLASSPQAVVTTQEPEITIEPPSPDIVYIPVCDPFVVYGGWPDAGYLPDSFPEYFDGATPGGFGCAWIGAPIVPALWGWRHWRWRDHRIDVDRDKFAALNGHRPPIGDSVWGHDPSHRRGVPYRDPQVRGRFAAPTAPEQRRALRGYPEQTPPRVVPTPRTVAPPPVVRRPPSFESFGGGADVRIQSERGYSSRMSAPTFAAPPVSRPSISAPSFSPRPTAPGGFAPPSAPSGGGPRLR